MKLPSIQLPTVHVPANVEATVERMTTAVRSFEFPSIDMQVDLPKFEMPEFDMPKFEMPEFDMPKLESADADRVVDFARDAAYVGVGVAVVTMQKADERRRELTETMSTRVRELVDAVG